jgi:hypothetical protein
MLKKKRPSEGKSNSASLAASVFFVSLHFSIFNFIDAEALLQVPCIFLAEEIILIEKISMNT